jgi:hypothetical protein
VVFFTTAVARETEELVERIGTEARFVMLVEDFGGLEKEFGRREVIELLRKIAARGREIGIWDVEGVELAKRLGVREVPAVAVRRAGRWHVAAGARADSREIERCTSR